MNKKTHHRYNANFPMPIWEIIREVQEHRNLKSALAAIEFLVRLGHHIFKLSMDPDQTIMIHDKNTGKETGLTIIS